jgi:hypothetical protein
MYYYNFNYIDIIVLIIILKYQKHPFFFTLVLNFLFSFLFSNIFCHVYILLSYIEFFCGIFLCYATLFVLTS